MFAHIQEENLLSFLVSFDLSTGKLGQWVVHFSGYPNKSRVSKYAAILCRSAGDKIANYKFRENGTKSWTSLLNHGTFSHIT